MGDRALPQEEAELKPVQGKLWSVISGSELRVSAHMTLIYLIMLLLSLKQNCGVHASKMAYKREQGQLDHVSVLVSKEWHNVMTFHYSWENCSLLNMQFQARSTVDTVYTVFLRCWWWRSVIHKKGDVLLWSMQPSMDETQNSLSKIL